MKRIVLASANPDKLAEIRRFLEPLGIEVTDMRSAGFAKSIVEDGATFQENAAKKAETVAKALKTTAVADDSGLVVPALDGAPGIHSARFAGDDATYDQHTALLLNRMKDLEGDERKAYFICVIALAEPCGETRFFKAERWGHITAEPKGSGGFGYDPVFFDPELGKTYAEDPDGKQRVSHRVQALRLLAEHLTRRE